VAPAKDIYQLTVLFVNLQEVLAGARRGAAEMPANGGHDRLPNGQERRHAGTRQDRAMKGEIVLNDRRLIASLAGAFQMVQDALPIEQVALVDLLIKMLERKRLDDPADGDNHLANGIGVGMRYLDAAVRLGIEQAFLRQLRQRFANRPP